MLPDPRSRRDLRCCGHAPITSMGIRDKPIAAGSPWQNSFAERLIGTIRRECADHIVVLREAHLRRLLREYARYYNTVRTHRSLDQHAPVSRPVRIGRIVSHALVGLHRELESPPDSPRRYRRTSVTRSDRITRSRPTCNLSDQILELGIESRRGLKQRRIFAGGHHQRRWQVIDDRHTLAILVLH